MQRAAFGSIGLAHQAHPEALRTLINFAENFPESFPEIFADGLLLLITRKIAFYSSCGGLQPSAPSLGPFGPIQRPCRP